MNLTPLVFEHDRKTTLAGFREAIYADPPRPPSITFAEYRALNNHDRELFDQVREDFLRLKVRVETPEQKQCARILTRLIASNPRRKNSRRGLMISAPMFYGKTELALLLAQFVERKHAARNPDYMRTGEVPVVWVEMTEHSTGKALLAQIVEFLCPTITLNRSITTDRLKKMAVELLHTHQTKLLVIDEAHKLGGAEPSSIIKALQNESSATVLLVGINLLAGRAFGSGDGQQVTMRCDLVELRKVSLTHSDGMSQWLDWVIQFDRNLPLIEHTKGVLYKNAISLHKASGGQLAVLALIVERLVTSILDDAGRTGEQIDRVRLHAVLSSLKRFGPKGHRLKLEDLVDATVVKADLAVTSNEVDVA
ncbi:TniB family NTP-binding protein [Microbacterium sp. NPDC078814]|uniref:TniB family NTP-binding protein n=1 Tax=Microbacterium sp. NPDC078814 TaxID=3154767 RepID=UPI00344B45AE